MHFLMKLANKFHDFFYILENSLITRIVLIFTIMPENGRGNSRQKINFTRQESEHKNNTYCREQVLIRKNID